MIDPYDPFTQPLPLILAAAVRITRHGVSHTRRAETTPSERTAPPIPQPADWRYTIHQEQGAYVLRCHGVWCSSHGTYTAAAVAALTERS